MKPNCILLKTAPEISLKSIPVRQFFMKKLRENIKTTLRNKNLSTPKIATAGGRLFLYSKNLEELQPLIKNTFGVHSVAFAEMHKNPELKNITKKVLAATKKFFEKNDTFAVRVNQTQQNALSGREIESALGAEINKKHKKLNLKVNLSEPKKTVLATT